MYLTYTNFLLKGDHWSYEAQDEVEADEEPVEYTLHRPSVKNEHECDSGDRQRIVQGCYTHEDWKERKRIMNQILKSKLNPNQFIKDLKL